MTTNIQFWHLQMFPSDAPAFAEKVPAILQHKQFIGLGDWDEHRNQISYFCETMQVNDIVAIKKWEKIDCFSSNYWRNV